MEIMSANEASKRWHISQRRVAVLCAEQRIPGAQMVGNMWLLPVDTDKPKDARSARKTSDSKVKPIIKWAGGKGQLLGEIRKRYPVGLGTTIKKYAEPFVGGGAVLLDILGTIHGLDQVFISDINAELVNMYREVQLHVEDVISLLDNYSRSFIPLDTEARKAYYYNKRKRFNELKQKKQLDLELAALFIFLNKTCFNGLYRVNSKGENNVPMGSYRNPPICDADNLRLVSAALANIEIVCGDYRASQEFIDSNTFAYFDPPYRPLTQTASFTSYTEDCFNDDDQRQLASYVHKLAETGAHVLVSNSDPKNVNPNDNFFDDLYSPLTIERVRAVRMINSNGSGRGEISELLIHTPELQ